jgi:hypothetical protein
LRRAAAASLTRALAATPDQVQEWTGLAPENYVTASSLADLLASAWDGGRGGLGRLVGRRLWVAAVPEQTTVAGYVAGAHGTVLAVAVLIGEQLPTDGLFAAPTIRWAPGPTVAAGEIPRRGAGEPAPRRNLSYARNGDGRGRLTGAATVAPTSVSAP